MLDTYRKLFDLLTRRERRQFFLLLGMILVMGLIETTGVASIVPFMMVLADPTAIERNAYLGMAYSALGFTNPQSFMLFLGFVVFAIVVFGLLFKGLTYYAVYRFAMMRSYSISRRMLHGYLFQPYTWFLNRHSADIGANILSEVSRVVSTGLLPAMRFLTYSVIVVALVSLLVAVRPVVALAAAGLFGSSYAAIYLGVRKYLDRIGEERRRANEERFQVTNEAMGGIKDVKLLGLEEYFMQRFDRPARRLAEYEAAGMVVGEVPRYILEAVAFGGLIAFVLFLLVNGNGSLATIMPVLAVYAFAGVRIFPALQWVYVSTTSMRFSKPSLLRLHEDMMAATVNAGRLPRRVDGSAALPLTDRLELVDVHFSYPLAGRAALRGLDLEIPARTTVGIVGGTGAGKTTTVDMILGLLEAQQGEVRVDGVPITRENVRAWQRSIGYVPQQIFLTDDTVAGNVAFGLDAKDIDHAAVERAAKVAELHDFVVREMPEGYGTFVGERGVRLSGGQRQRVGIARALYHDPDVLILDEATSALDNLTERAVMDAVRNLGHSKTIIMIAHRLTTVRNCDIIVMLEEGRVVAMGSYDELFESNRKFQKLAGA